MRRLILLGATGSIGTQTLDLLEKDDAFSLVGIAIGHRKSAIPSLIKRFPSIEAVSLLDKDNIEELQGLFPKVRFYFGEDGASRLANETQYDEAVNAIVGFAGLLPSIEVLSKGKVLHLANKESLVVGGQLIGRLIKEKGGRIYPIDSEHAAIAKCLSSIDRKDIDKVILTASGGPFRLMSRMALNGITPAMALAHPTWKMGNKITIDSATMMNKGFEVMEACYLFDIEPEGIEILIHPQSMVHSGIRLKDGSYILDYGKPDMHGPIAYSLSHGEKIEGIRKVSSLDELKDCDFMAYDPARFPAVGLAIDSFKQKGNRGAVLNGANEMAVSLFLEGKLPFKEIEKVMEEVLKKIPFDPASTYPLLASYDSLARQEAKAFGN